MDVHYFHGSRPNFGDDLNADLWPLLLPPEVWDAPDTVLVGIGSILTRGARPEIEAKGRHVVVLGSGVSYGAAPTDIDHWNVLALRGPLSAAVLDRPAAAATDGAYLVADTPQLHGTPQARDEVLFIPHHRSLRGRPWAEAAAEAGLTFVSPEATVAEMFDHLARARLVVTEAMHGAIVADALRIPWIPVTVSSLVDEFKWRDWLGSVDVEFDPVSVPPPDDRDAAGYRRAAAVLDRHGMAGHRQLAGVDPSDERVVAWLEHRYADDLLADLLRAEVGSIVDRAVNKATPWRRSAAFDATVDGLVRAAGRPPNLSSDATMQSRLEQLRTAVGTAVSVMLAG